MSDRFRLAILSDIHGNSIALDAVLADIEAQGGVDEYWLLGDHVAIGPDPIGVLERIAQLPNAKFVRGNTDRYVFAGDRPYPAPEDVRADFDLLPRYRQVTDGFSWTQGAVTTHGWLPWLEALPIDVRCMLPDGTRLRGVHASPQSDDVGFMPNDSQDHLRQIAAVAETDILFAGHVHYPSDQTIDDVRLVNVGSVSNPRLPSRVATYGRLTADATHHALELRHVSYDYKAVLEQLHEQRHPSANFIEDHSTADLWSI